MRILSALASLILLSNSAFADQAVYTDSLQNGWQSYGWATLNYSSTNVIHSGSDAISVNAAAWQALYLHHDAQDSTGYAALSFYINGGPSGGQKLQVQATLNGSAQTPYPIGPLAANTWMLITIPLTTLGVPNNPNFDGFWIQDTTGTTQPVFYVDDISLISGTSNVPPSSPNSGVTINVDATANVHAINPLIYGACFATAAQVADLRLPLNRQGGNAQTRYNWQLNADNRANDYYFESIGDTSAVAGERGDDFISDSKTNGAEPMLTIPMIPWIAKLGANRAKLASFSVAKYGPQNSTDPYMPDAGNGDSTSGANITGNNPNDANTPNSISIESAWAQHLVAKWGAGSSTGLKYYIMDNEPSLWCSTHRDVAPTGLTMAQLKTSILTYSAAVKAVDPSALVVGPEEWGWSGYFYSGYDQQYAGLHGYSYYPDRTNNGGADYLPWLLQQIQQNDAGTGKRSLDVFSVHYYPQRGEYGNDVSQNMELIRNQTTRDLWDPSYVSQSWIGTQVMLIPRLKSWIDTYYPGTKVAITEYSWGADNSINGATTQADIFGIFGREVGLDMATRWITPDTGTPTYNAMKMYRNYDSSGSAFGETSVSDSVPNPDNLSSFAALRSDGTMTLIVVNKVLTGSTPITVNLAHFTSGATAQAWQLTSANAITHLADVALNGGTLTATVPPQSVTLFVIPEDTSGGGGGGTSGGGSGSGGSGGTSGGGTSASGPFSGSSLGSGWDYSTWFGTYNSTFYPWIYRTDLGFMWVDAVGTDLYLWVDSGASGSLGWIYTNQSIYPKVYSFTKGTWLYSSVGTTQFYNWSTQQWENY